MPEETKESKAKKLAAIQAARKKLKEYQNRGPESSTTNSCEALSSNASQQEQQASATGSVTSNLSERSDSELNLNGNGSLMGNSGTATPTTSVHNENIIEVAAAPETITSAELMQTINEMPAVTTIATAASYFNTVSTSTSSEMNFQITPENFFNTPTLPEPIPMADQQNLNTIQLLITEKTQLTTELNKYRSLSREKDLELEELRIQHVNSLQRLEDLQQKFVTQQQTAEQLRNSNAELQHKLAQSNAHNEDQVSYLSEVRKQLNVVQERSNDLERLFKEKCTELEMSNIRIRQLSDEASISKDNRVETLTQTQFMYEQQIRDLQAMVQQLTQDKEQANTQYQNYVQHLNSEVTNLNEKNLQLMSDWNKSQDNERQLIEHISELERQIQKNISRQQCQEEKNQVTPAPSDALTNEIEKLKEKINDFDLERHEFQLKIKSQEDRLEQLNAQLEQRRNESERLREHLENISSEQPDKVKLLATMESDKVAASRAVQQNVEMKKQLDELELRFVQLTNDKADLMNKLDSELYANREMRSNYSAMEERLQTTDERFKFKDEEMIRLSHENMELSRDNLILQQQVDRLRHYEVEGYSEKYTKEREIEDPATTHHHGENHEHDHCHDHDEDDQCDAHVKHNHHNEHNEHTKSQNNIDDDGCEEAKEFHEHTVHTHEDVTEHQGQKQTHFAPSTTVSLPTSEAVERLQQRFTQLMTQVADLTDEKQRLEHLVLQLQGETETIGEYIALYQTQRRMLKQREYEKAAQMELLQNEREQLREKVTLLNSLVSSLGVELPQNKQLKQHLNAALAEEVSIEPTAGTPQNKEGGDTVDNPQQEHSHEIYDENILSDKLNTKESQEIITKIQNIITEIKENTKEIPTVTHTADHLNCCLGKFEVV